MTFEGHQHDAGEPSAAPVNGAYITTRVRTYFQLTDDQKKEARNAALGRLLDAVVAGEIRFNDEANGDRLQARIDDACQQVDDMRTPWFAHEYIMEAVGDTLRSIADAEAEDALYPTADADIIRLGS